MKKAMYKRKNPLIALVMTQEEYDALKNLSAHHGVSIAQLARGYMRYSMDSGLRSSVAVRVGRMLEQ